MNPSRQTHGATTASVVIIALVLVLVGAMYVLGERAPSVAFDAEGVHIRAMYSADIPYSEISRVELMEKSMQDIGVGTRTNGYEGFSGTLRGHFASDSLGSYLLFVTPASAPTIYIDRVDGEDVYLSFADAAQTRAVYAELTAAMPQP